MTIPAAGAGAGRAIAVTASAARTPTSTRFITMVVKPAGRAVGARPASTREPPAPHEPPRGGAGRQSVVSDRSEAEASLEWARRHWAWTESPQPVYVATEWSPAVRGRG